MEDHLVKFDLLDWITPAKEIRYKKYMKGSIIIRLLEFSYGFVEEEYCTKGHTGFVLEGSFSIDYNGKLESYSAGDVICIPSGEKGMHKAILSDGQKVKLLLFEEEQPINDNIEYYI